MRHRGRDQQKVRWTFCPPNAERRSREGRVWHGRGYFRFGPPSPCSAFALRAPARQAGYGEATFAKGEGWWS